ncbi:MAG TPA: hypothetical protein VHL58_09885 [Thermoanaerobaculia bacterium]|nr:hypothetical protein [Thermoanaerobaculia bacterium]
MRKLRALTLATLLLTAPLATAATPHRNHPSRDRDGIIERVIDAFVSLITTLEDSVLSIPNG